MFPSHDVVNLLRGLGITHLVWLPDSEIGTWEDALAAQSDIHLVRVCREGEAWAIAAGLYLGGKRPIVAIQCTGLFESGDALRNACFDLGLPLFAIIGYRSYLVPLPPLSAGPPAPPPLRLGERAGVKGASADGGNRASGDRTDEGDGIRGDSARHFTEPVLKAWGLPYRLVTRPDQLGVIAEHYRDCQAKGRPGVVLLAEGRG